MVKRLSKRTIRWIMASALIVWLVLMVIGFFVGYDLAEENKGIAGIVGVMLAGAVWVVLCWTFAFILRGQLRRRGYDLSPQVKQS